MNVIELPGLRARNMAGYVSLLGVLKLLQLQDVRCRGGWCRERETAYVLVPEIDREELVRSLSLGLHKLKGIVDGALPNDVFLEEPTKWNDNDVRKHFRRLKRGQTEDVVAAFTHSESSEATSNGVRRYVNPLLTYPAGRKNEAFLYVLRSALDHADVKRLHGRSQLTANQVVAETLFLPWTRPNIFEDTPRFRWDHGSLAVHAKSFGPPTSTSRYRGAQFGAVRLCAAGWLAIPGAPRRRKLSAPGWGYRKWTYPVWSEPASLEAVEAMLASPRGGEGAFGIWARMESRYIEVGSGAKRKNAVVAVPVATS